jgi:hypothetical protein
VNLKPEEWGWKIVKDKLAPIQMTVKPGPEFLMAVIRCQCTSKSMCSSRLCSCVKNQLKCIAACGNCHGVDCANADDTNKVLQVTDNDELSIDSCELTDVIMNSDGLWYEREEDVYDDGSGCEFVFDSQVEAQIAMSMEEVL